MPRAACVRPASEKETADLTSEGWEEWSLRIKEQSEARQPPRVENPRDFTLYPDLVGLRGHELLQELREEVPVQRPVHVPICVRPVVTEADRLRQVEEEKRLARVEALARIDAQIDRTRQRLFLIIHPPKDPEEKENIPPIIEVFRHIVASHHPSREGYPTWKDWLDTYKVDEKLPKFKLEDPADPDEPGAKSLVRMQLIYIYHNAFNPKSWLPTNKNIRTRAKEVAGKIIHLLQFELENYPDQYKEFRNPMRVLRRSYDNRLTELEWQIPGTAPNFIYESLVSEGWYVAEPRELRLLPFKEYIRRSLVYNSAADKALWDDIKRHRKSTNMPFKYAGELDADEEYLKIQQEMLDFFYKTAFTPCDCKMEIDYDDDDESDEDELVVNLRFVEKSLSRFKRMLNRYPEIETRPNLNCLYLELLSGLEFRVQELKWVTGDEKLRDYYQRYDELFDEREEHTLRKAEHLKYKKWLNSEKRAECRDWCGATRMDHYDFLEKANIYGGRFKRRQAREAKAKARKRQAKELAIKMSHFDDAK